MLESYQSQRQLVTTQPGQKPEERRRDRRYRLAAPVTFRPSGDSTIAVAGLTQEISEGGLSAFLGKSNLVVGETVDVELSLPAGALQARALVRSRLASHFRFEFVDLTPEQLQQIKNCIQKLSPFRTLVMSVGGGSSS